MAEPNRLDALDDRHKKAHGSETHHAYSAIVKKLRWALPSVVLFIIAVLMIWPKIEVEISERRFAPSKLDRAALEQAATENRLLNANFSSVNEKGQPFTVTASEAVQENNNPDTVILQSPQGSLKTSETETMTAQSKNGIYAQKDQQLTLNDDVVLTRSDGTVMNTQTLSIDLMRNTARTITPVEVDGPQGHLSAQGMDMTDNGGTIIFPGPAKLILKSGNSIDPRGDH